MRLESTMMLVATASIGCGTDTQPAPAPGDAGPPASTTFTEQALTLELTLATAAGSGSGSASGSADPITTLEITARDGTTPVITDLWLYALADDGAKTPLTTFTSTAARKSGGLMLPATIGGQPSGLTPVDTGVANGFMTNLVRGKLVQGAFVSTVDGTVIVTLPAPPAQPILVVAGVEDQRYAGAAVVAPDGTALTPPADAGVAETHTRRTYSDVAPILHDHCGQCHRPDAVDAAVMYLVDGTRDELVNDNFARTEDAADCRVSHPDGGSTYNACVLAITKAEFLVEPGVPALSGLISRSRPDENGGTSSQGLAWYGSHGLRYNATYGDRRMPSTTTSVDQATWTNAPTDFDTDPSAFQILYDWVAQGAQP